MKTKITYDKLLVYDQAVAVWLERTSRKPEDNGAAPETSDEIAQRIAQRVASALKNPTTKLGYAIYRMSSQVERISQEYAQKTEDIRIDHCSVDEKKNILRDVRGQYLFTPEQLKAANLAMNRLRESEVEITPYIARIEPDDLTVSEREAFNGIVLPEIDIDQWFEERFAKGSPDKGEKPNEEAAAAEAGT